MKKPKLWTKKKKTAAKGTKAGTETETRNGTTAMIGIRIPEILEEIVTINGGVV